MYQNNSIASSDFSIEIDQVVKNKIGWTKGGNDTHTIPNINLKLNLKKYSLKILIKKFQINILA